MMGSGFEDAMREMARKKVIKRGYSIVYVTELLKKLLKAVGFGKRSR